MQKKTPAVSVIIAVYNNFLWLRLILDALRMQTFKDFEVIICDDGSSQENVDSLYAYMQAHPEMTIIHSWHPDEGWRKNKALNQAVRRSSAPYLIFVDGDCIPHPRFVEDHIRMKAPGFVIGGRRVESRPSLNELVESWTELPKNYFSQARRRIIASTFKDGFGKMLFQLRRTIRFPFIFGRPFGMKPHGFLGANFAIHRADLEKVNGFDERYVDPGTGEDSDLDLRLEHAGIYHRKVSHNALMIHRCHKRLFLDAQHNKDLYAVCKRERLTYVATGLYPPSES
ncbi:MAG: glycosyltransferase [Muribaculaceae bacterium]|nr:glycosyltransferase [Muribaculaceae bacterium]